MNAEGTSKRTVIRAGGTLALGLVFVLALVVWDGVSPREPRYEGQTYRQWMRGISLEYAEHSDRWRPAEDALRAMGTNGLPWILRELQVREYGPLREGYFLLIRQTAYRHPRVPLVKRLATVYADPSIRRQDGAIALISLAEQLGTNRLSHLMAHPDPRVGRAAADALGNLFVETFKWTDSRPTDFFSQALLSSNSMVRAAAAHGLNCVGGIGAKEVERLLALLSDPVPVVRRSASEVVLALGLAEQPGAAEALAEARWDEDPQTQSNVVEALTSIGQRPGAR